MKLVKPIIRSGTLITSNFATQAIFKDVCIGGENKGKRAGARDAKGQWRAVWQRLKGFAVCAEGALVLEVNRKYRVLELITFNHI